jgi:hypothetical protein
MLNISWLNKLTIQLFKLLKYVPVDIDVYCLLVVCLYVCCVC